MMRSGKQCCFVLWKQRGPRAGTEAYKIFQALHALTFAAEMLLRLQLPVICRWGQLDTPHFLRGPNDPSCRTFTATSTVLPAAVALRLQTGLSRPEELFKYCIIKK